jgi:hypothetical protein
MVNAEPEFKAIGVNTKPEFKVCHHRCFLRFKNNIAYNIYLSLHHFFRLIV